jgi:hypothetical protein
MSIAESCTLPPARPRRTLRTIVRRDFRTENLSPFGKAWCPQFPDEKPDVALAQRIKKSERVAQMYLFGERDPSLSAILALVDVVRGNRRR